MSYRIDTRVLRALYLSSVLCILSMQAFGQSAAIIGTVTDSETGEPLAGANVLVHGTAIGSATDAEGDFEISVFPGMHLLHVSFIGYAAQESVVTLTAGETHIWEIALVPGTDLDPVQVTAGRRSEKALDAPSSIDVVTARDLQYDISPTAARSLRNITGLDMIQTGVDRQEIALRGFNTLFSTTTHILTDYRDAGTPSVGLNLHTIMPALSIDTDRIEIVRGPGSALYGPGADSGVIHYISKDPFNYPGATVSIGGGQQSMLNAQGRIATVIGKNLGIKLIGSYATAEDFALRECDAALLEAERFSECPDPEDALQLSVDDASRDTAHEKWLISGSVDWRAGSQTTLSLHGGISHLDGTVLSGIGTVRASRMANRYAQARLSSGPFFVQAYMNSFHSGTSYIYGGDPVSEYSEEYTVQAQYTGVIGSWQKLIAGVDLILDRPDTRGTVLGRNEEKDDINQYGTYLQSVTKISSKLELTMALRGDYHSVVDDIQLSPRVALVMKPTPSSSLRATYNRSFSPPPATSYFLDLVVASLGSLNVRGRGRTEGFHYMRNDQYLALGAPTSLVASSMLPGMEGSPTPVGIDTGYLYGLIYEGLKAIPVDDLIRQLEEAGAPIPPNLVPLLIDAFNPEVTPVQGFSPGVLGLLNLSTRTLDTSPRLNDLENFGAIKPTITHSWEIGYKGILSDRVLIAIDGYFSKRRNFLGDLQIVTPFVLVPDLQKDLIRDIAAGIHKNTQLASGLDLFGLTPEYAAETLVNLAGGDLPDAQTPVAVVQVNENNRGKGNFPELMLTYPVFGNIQYFGIDLAAQVAVSNDFMLSANSSWVSNNYFDHEELNEESEDWELALNAPSFKAKLGGRYQLANRVSFTASGRYIDGFPARAGQYVGDVESYIVVDLGAGYSLSRMGVRIDLGVSNALDSNHREFVGAPRLGRVASLRLTYTTD